MSQALVILCGGDSSRMGTDKALLPFGNECLLEYMVHKFSPYFDKIYLSVKNRGDYRHLNLNVTEIPDIYLNAGPMGAILSSLTMIVEKRAVFLSIDTPFVQPVVCQRLLTASEKFDAASICLKDAYVDAILFVYSKSCIPAFGKSILMGNISSSHIQSKCFINRIPLETADKWSPLPIEEQLFRLFDRESYYLALFQQLKLESTL